MKRYGYFLVFLLAVACRTDFQVNEKWKEIDIVYGLLDIKDSVQYIKINKAYLNDKTSALKIAQEIDSLYHKDSLKVTLSEYHGGGLTRQVQLLKVFKNNKDTGIFASPGQYLYRTPPGFRLDSVNGNVSYAIEVLNTVTGVKANSATPVVQQLQPDFPNASTKAFNITRGVTRPINWYSGKGAKFYDFTVSFVYSEYKETTSEKLKTDTLAWPIFRYQVMASTNGGENLVYNMHGDDFFDFIGDHIKPANGIYRTLDYITMDMQAGGEELYNYISVNTPSLGVVQKLPEYTNITNGYGIFSSRTSTHFSLAPALPTHNTLLSDTALKALNFR